MNKQTCKRHVLHRRTERRPRGIGVAICGFWDMRAERQADVQTDGLIIGGGKTSSSDSVIMLLAVHSGKRKATITCPSVCLSHIFNDNAVVINEQCLVPASVRFSPSVRGPLHLLSSVSFSNCLDRDTKRRAVKIGTHRQYIQWNLNDLRHLLRCEHLLTSSIRKCSEWKDELHRRQIRDNSLTSATPAIYSRRQDRSVGVTAANFLL